MLFEFFAYLTGLAVLALAVVAWVMYRDSFHPLIYIGPMLVFLYSFLPLYLAFTQREELRGYLGDADLIYVQLLNGLGALTCASVFCLVALVRQELASRGLGRHPTTSVGGWPAPRLFSG